MADVFISYSSKDRALAETLARDIEAAGWSVWWDPEIRAGEDFTERILAELDAAKVVVVIWTKHSVKSPWVRSEAGRAKRAPRDRYVAVREEGLDEHDIPPPFDQRHATPIDEFAEVRRALSPGLVSALDRVPAIPGGRTRHNPAEESAWLELQAVDPSIDDKLRVCMYLDFLERFPRGTHSANVLDWINQAIHYYGTESAAGAGYADGWEGQLKRIYGTR